MKNNWILGIAMLSGQTWANSGELFNVVESYFKRRDELEETIKEYRSEIKTELRNSVREYYESVKKFYLYENLKKQIDDACSGGNASNDPCPSLSNALSDLENGRALSNDYKVSLQSQTSPAIVAALEPPNPLRYTELRPSMMAEFIKANKRKAESLRAKSNDPLNVKSENEQDFFVSIEENCKKSASEKQKEAGSIMKDPIINPIAKALKCSVLPTIATLYADTTIQKATLAVAGAQVEDRREGWNINCDPGEIAAFDSMRPTDPNVVAQQWGLPQLANPPWIQNMRTLPMLGAPFMVTPLPGGGYMTPYGTVAVPVEENFGSNPNAASAGSRARQERAQSSRKGPQGSRARTSGRRLVQAESAGRAVRGLAAQVSSGRAVDENLNALRSGAQNTRALAISANTKMKNRGLANLSKDRAASAKQYQSVVRNLSGSRASRTTSQSILNSLRGNRGSVGNPTGPTVGDIRKETERERRRIEMLVRMYVENIETARRKAEEVRVKIMQKISEHDLATMKVMDKLTDKPPRKQATIMMNLRTELNGITRELAELKSSYDVYQASIMEQGMLIKNLASFGVKAPNFPGFGGQNDPNKIPSEFPKVGRGSRVNSSSFDVFKKLLDTTKAWAAARLDLGVFQSEAEWLAAWNQHTKDYEKYAGSVVKTEKDAVGVAAKIISNRFESVSADEPDLDDVETLVSMYEFSDALSSETRQLLEDSAKGKVSLNGNQISLLRRIDQDSQQSVEALESVFLGSKEFYSKSLKGGSALKSDGSGSLAESDPGPYLEMMFSYLAE